jgi:hypothetical protein
MDVSSCVGRYDGQFHEDMMHGCGVFTSDEGGWTYSGALEQKRPTEGELVEADGRRFKVTYDKDCAFIFANPKVKTKVCVVCGAAAEELCCRDTVQEDSGKLRLVWIGDGSTYEGEWVYGKCHGRGISTYADGAR